jgi:uncharacterized protein YndB with AHSA1/START domain
MIDHIEKTIDINAPVSRVWKALTDHEEFSAWFRVRLDGPFVVGQVSHGEKISPPPGREHIRWEAVIQKIEPERYFSFTWRPYATDPKADDSGEPPTLVEFTLEKTATGTRFRVVESGFDKIPSHRRDEVFRMHEGGWNMQMQNIVRHIEHA